MGVSLYIPLHAKTENITTKDAIFSILSNGVSLTVTQLKNAIKKQFALSVTFQATLKAVKSLCVENVLKKEKFLYTLNEEWIYESKTHFDKLHNAFTHKIKSKKVNLSADVVVYTVSNLLEVDKVWNESLINWSKNEKVDFRNCWIGRHAWWLIPRLQDEDMLHDHMLSKKVKTYNVWTKKEKLDIVAQNYYKRKGINVATKISKDSDVDTHISVFGEFVLKFTIPKVIARKIEELYETSKQLEDQDMKKTIDIFKEDAKIEVMIVKDPMLADSLKKEIISYF